MPENLSETLSSMPSRASCDSIYQTDPSDRSITISLCAPILAVQVRQASGEEGAPAPDEHTVLLTEIRDALRK